MPLPPAIRIPDAPPKPLMIWDGDCRFCGRWIRRWGKMTRGRIDYVPQQQLPENRFPGLSRKALEEAVHIVMPDGRIYRGAAAVLISLRRVRGAGWLIRAYTRSSLFARICEGLYNWVARNRMILSKIL